MAWSFPIARIFGTQVRIHLTFLLLVLFFGVTAYGQSGLHAALISTSFVLLLFTCVTLHEFGHVFAARAFGIETPTITLLPIGGLARLKRIPRQPYQEIIIALAGPAVNIVIALVLVAIPALRNGLELPTMEPQTMRQVGQMLIFSNLFMVAFNMIPAFPMDGGRVFRALLAVFLPYAKATTIAAVVGQSFAFLGGFLAISNMGELWPLMLVAVFIFIAAAEEASASRRFLVTEGARVADAMLTQFRVLRPEQTLGEAADLLVAVSQTDFPVMDEENNTLRGVLTRRDLIGGLRQLGPEAPIDKVLTDCGEPVLASEELEPAVQVMNDRDCPAIPVVETAGGPIVGLLTMENLSEMIMVRTALYDRRH